MGLSSDPKANKESKLNKKEAKAQDTWKEILNMFI